MSVASKAFDKLFKNKDSSEYTRLKETLKLAALLHDIGHAPLSHSTESVMPEISKLRPPTIYQNYDKSRQATHEDYTIKTIVDSSFTDSFKEAISCFGVSPFAIADLIIGESTQKDYFLVEGIDYFPLLHQLISSEMDCDRMDYLLRDSYFCGVSYGHHDLDWIIDNLICTQMDNKAYLGISERAVSTFDDFLLCRYHMFLMVYFHYRSVCLEQMLYKYFSTSNNEYIIPADIEQYRIHDDYYLTKILRESTNTWAKRIIT